MDKLIVLGMGIPYPYPTHGHNLDGLKKHKYWVTSTIPLLQFCLSLALSISVKHKCWAIMAYWLVHRIDNATREKQKFFS